MGNEDMLSGHWIATVTVRSSKPCVDGNVKDRFPSPDNEQRLQDLERIVDYILEDREVGNGIILFPAGWMDADTDPPDRLHRVAESRLQQILPSGRHIVVCLGIDGRGGVSQTAIAVNKNGMIAEARKFFPAPGEKICEGDPESERRKFKIGDQTYYLAVCYDIYGVRKRPMRNLHKADAILNLVHGFCERGEGSGFTYFAKWGCGGASICWKCPVFASAVFFRRKIPQNWPSGVYVKEQMDRGDIKSLRLKDISLVPQKESRISKGLNEAEGLIRIFRR